MGDRVPPPPPILAFVNFVWGKQEEGEGEERIYSPRFAQDIFLLPITLKVVRPIFSSSRGQESNIFTIRYHDATTLFAFVDSRHIPLLITQICIGTSRSNSFDSGEGNDGLLPFSFSFTS